MTSDLKLFCYVRMELGSKFFLDGSSKKFEIEIWFFVEIVLRLLINISLMAIEFSKDWSCSYLAGKYSTESFVRIIVLKRLEWKTIENYFSLNKRIHNDQRELGSNPTDPSLSSNTSSQSSHLSSLSFVSQSIPLTLKDWREIMVTSDFSNRIHMQSILSILMWLNNWFSCKTSSLLRSSFVWSAQKADMNPNLVKNKFMIIESLLHLRTVTDVISVKLPRRS